MKVIYYSTAYHAAHGGSTHSRHFVNEARKHPSVDSIIVFPQGPITGAAPQQHSWRERLRKLLRSIPLLQVLFFYRRNRFNAKGLECIIEKERPDAVLMRLDSNFLQIRTLRLRFPSLIIATEVNASPFSESFSNIASKGRFQKKEAAALTLSDCNFFVSENLRQRIMGGLANSCRDHVVHNGVDTTVFTRKGDREQLRRRLGFSMGMEVVGYIGTLDEHKYIENLLYAFAQLIQKRSTLYLVIIGDGPALSVLKALSTKLGIHAAVRFTGWINHRQVPDYLNCFDIAVHHHAQDYMSPLKLFEYLAAGLPVVGPDIPAVREIFEDGTHLVLTTKNTDDIAAKIKFLLESKIEAEELAVRGRTLVLQYFTWQQNADRILKILSAKVRKSSLEQ
jgi:glycosyltransferase involved in cell wall biosynthesis